MYSPQTRLKLRRGVLLIVAIIATVLWSLDYAGALDWLENRTSDWRVRATVDPSRASRDIVIIDIDNASFRVITEQLGPWPWTRRLWAELLLYVTPGRPKLVLFDALFSGSNPEVDVDFAAAIKQAGNVLLPFAFVSGRIAAEADFFTPPSGAEVKLAGHRDSLSKRDWSINKPTQTLAAAAAGSGANLWTPDPDGITRRLPLAIRYEGRDWATFWLATARKLRGEQAGRTLPLDGQGRFVVKWHGDTLTSYRHVPLWEMVCSMQPEVCDKSVKRHPPEEFAGKIVFIGATAAGSYEVRPTAVSETAPGVFVLATALDNLLNDHAIRLAPRWLTAALILILAVLPAWPVLASRSVMVPLAATIFAVALYSAAGVFFYSRSFWLPMSAPVLAAALSFSGNTAWRYFTADRELSRTRGTLERYVSPQLVRHVMDHLNEFRFDGEKRKLTVFFSDVRGFTTLTEKSDPVELLKQLNEYLEAMTDIVFRHDGIVDKFIGDGIMAHWGAFTPDRPNARLAALASLEMIDALGKLNAKWSAAGKPTLDIGIGLNTAEVIFGNVGTGKKVDFTAIGDGVNLAARLEGTNKEYHTHIIISDATRRELGETAKVRPLGSIVVKGKTVGVEIFELLGLDS